MRENIVTIGDKIELSHYSKDATAGHRKKAYVSQLLDLGENNKATIAMPMESGRIFPIEVGEKYNLCFFTKLGLYRCDCIVTERYKSEQLYIATIEFISDLEKFQRRQYFRLECVINAKYRVITDKEIDLLSILKKKEFQNEEEKKKITDMLEEFPMNWMDGVITNISGGGVRVNSESKQNPGEKIMLTFSLFTSSGLKVYQIISNLVKSSPVPNRSSIYEHRIEFRNINKEERESIVRYVFDEERKQRRKEKGLD